MEIDIEDEKRIVAVRGDKSDPLFRGYTYQNRQLADQYHSPSRLRSPLKKILKERLISLVPQVPSMK